MEDESKYKVQITIVPGWPQRGLCMALVCSSRKLPVENNNLADYMHTRWTMNGILKDLLNEGRLITNYN